MNLNLILFSILLISMSCSGVHPRKASGCVVSRYYGGPYRIISSDATHLQLVKVQTKQIKEFPKDNTWMKFPCDPI